MTTYKSDSFIKNIDGFDSEFVLKDLFFILSKSKKLITLTTFIFTCLGFLYLSTSKKVYQGGFQIVLQQSNNPSSTASLGNINLRNINLFRNYNGLETEVAILKSPSVLMNAFEYFKKEKQSLTNNVSNNIRFKDWRDDYLTIGLDKGTSILNISYQDTDKELIIPVLTKISKIYQQYSGNKKLKEIESGLSFYQDQINSYKIKSLDSLQKLQKYKIDEGLNFLVSKNKSKDQSPINLEKSIIEASNKIKQLEHSLEVLYNLRNNNDLISFSSVIKENKDYQLVDMIKKIDRKILSYKLIYKENDPIIMNLIKEKNSLLENLKEKLIGSLKAEKSNAEYQFKLANRPTDVLVKFRKLSLNATKDQETLSKLEDNYRLLSLAKAKTEKPWELITKPTLLPNHIDPQLDRVLIISVLLGSMFGILSSILIYKKKDIIFNKNEISSIYKWHLINEVIFDDNNEYTEYLDIAIEGFFKNIENKTAILKVGNLNDDETNKTINYLRNNLGKNFFNSTSISKAISFKNIVLLAKFGETKKKEIRDIVDQISQFKNINLSILIIKQTVNM